MVKCIYISLSFRNNYCHSFNHQIILIFSKTCGRQYRKDFWGIFSPFCVNLRAFTSKIENIDKRLTHLLPTLHNIFYFCSIFLKEEEVHVGCELRHGAQHEGDGGQDHHGQRQEGVDLDNKKLFSWFFFFNFLGLKIITNI